MLKQDAPCFVWDRFLDYRPSANTVDNSHRTSMVDYQVCAQDSTFGSSLRIQV